MTIPEGIITPSGRASLPKGAVMFLLLLIVAAVGGWWFAGLLGAGVGVGLALLACSVTTQLWALLQESKVFQFIVAGALVILSVVTFAVR
jgi:hypothetical protein